MKQLRDLSEKFVTDTLGSALPKGNCFGICFPLSMHLENNGIETLIKSGFVNNKDPHYILTLKNNDEIIIDPTIRQFDTNGPIVFIGKKPDNYGEFKTFDIEGLFKDWVIPLFDYGRRINLEGKYEQVADIKVLLRIHLKTATILSKEIDILDSFKNYNYSELHKMYFDAIYKMVIIYKDEKEKLVDHLLLNEFAKLLSQAAKFKNT